MAKVGVNNDPLHERLMFGYDGTDYRVVKVDTGGNLVFAALADQNIQARDYGWISGAWQKNPLMPGFSAAGAINYYNGNLPAGSSDQSMDAVPAGEYWKLTLGVMYISTTTITSIRLSAVVNLVTVPILLVLTPVSARYYPQICDVLMGPADYLSVAVTGATLGDDLIVRGSYWRIDTDQ